MAFNKGKETTENSNRIVRYIGVAPCQILAVNPTQEKANELLGYEAPIAPYVSEVEVGGKKVKNVRIDFIVRTDEEKCGVAVTGKLTYYLQATEMVGSKSGKIQVMDPYGRTAWATPEEIAGKLIPTYTSGPANISNNYRKCCVGEEELTKMLINFLGIPNVQKWDNATKTFSKELIANPADAEARLDNIPDYFKGVFKELSTVVGYQPDNKIKLLWGVRTVEKEGQMRTYQVIYNRTTLPYRTTNYDKLKKEIEDRKNNGALADTEFFVNGNLSDFQEYTVEPTDFSSSLSAPTSFDSPSDLPWSN